MGALPRWCRESLAELVGTYLLLLLGLSATASSILKQNVDPLPVAITFGVANMLAIGATLPISGGHLNPTVTLAFVSIGKTSWRKLAPYLIGQYIGAFLAAATVFGVNFEAINSFDGGHRQVTGVNGTGAIFSTYPAPFIENWATPLIDQIVTAGSYVFTTLVVVEPPAGVPTWAKPPMLGVLLLGHALAYGLNCGAVINPARDLAPRLFQLVANYGLEPFRLVQFGLVTFQNFKLTLPTM